MTPAGSDDSVAWGTPEAVPSGFDLGGSALRWKSRVVWSVAGRGSKRMKNRRNSGLIGRARRVLTIGVPAVGLAVAMIGVAPAQQAFAQDLGADIAETVAAAGAGIATHSSDGGTVLGGISSESNNLELGETEGTALSDASGGNYNVSANEANNDSSSE